MKYLPIAFGAIAVAAIIFAAMWWGWRARVRRDLGVTGVSVPLSGALIEHFADVMYVSTTPAGQPLVRVAAPGLRYRGPADVDITEDGVRVQVRGEHEVTIGRSQLRGASTAARRVGKAVEPGGISLILWESDGRQLESGFRLASAGQQRRFAEALTRVADPPPIPIAVATTERDTSAAASEENE